MVESKSNQEIEALFNGNKFDDCVSITIRCKDYSKRKKVVTKRQKIDGFFQDVP